MGRKVHFKNDRVKTIVRPYIHRPRYRTPQLFCADISARVTMFFCQMRCGIAKRNDCCYDVWHVHQRMSARNRANHNEALNRGQ